MKRLDVSVGNIKCFGFWCLCLISKDGEVLIQRISKKAADMFLKAGYPSQG